MRVKSKDEEKEEREGRCVKRSFDRSGPSYVLFSPFHYKNREGNDISHLITSKIPGCLVT